MRFNLSPQVVKYVGTALTILSFVSNAAALERGTSSLQSWQVVSVERLDALRGGFEMSPSMRVSFGIERAIYVNGELVASVNIQIPDLSRITQDQARALASTNSALNLVQNGPGNVFQPVPEVAAASIAASTSLGHMPTPIGTVIQNTLSNQQINSLLRIDAVVNTLEGFKNMHAHTALNQALANATGGR
jgi:hypothetical protein